MMNITERDELASYISDSYKSLYGHRPRFFDWEVMSIEALRSEADRMSDEIEYEIHRDRVEMERNLDSFLQYAPTQEVAKRWIQEMIDDVQ